MAWAAGASTRSRRSGGGVIGVGADGVGREAEAAGDVRDGEAVDGHERWRRSRRTQLMVLMIKELTQQAQATTASKRSTRGVAQVMAIVKALRAAGYDVSPTRRGHIRVSRDGRAVTTFSGTASDRRAHRNALAALRRDGFQWPPGR